MFAQRTEMDEYMDEKILLRDKGWAGQIRKQIPSTPPPPPLLLHFFFNNQKNKYLSNDPSLHLVKHSQEE